MAPGLLAAFVICAFLAIPGESARAAVSLEGSHQRLHAEAESEQTQGSGIWILMAMQAGRRGHGGSTYYEPPDRGCAAIRNTSYPVVCSGMSGDGWECKPRVLTAGGTEVQQNAPNDDNNLCPTYISCSCKKVGYSGDYTAEMCKSRMHVKHEAFLEPVHREICPAFVEACEEDCDSSWSADKCKREKCTVEACLNDFPRYTPEFMMPYSKKDVGCWGRLKGNGMLGKSVLRSIAEYESLSKCCYLQQTQDGPREFKWCSGNELVKSWRPQKLISGRKVCNAEAGWHSANHLGLDASTKEKCESLE